MKAKFWILRFDGDAYRPSMVNSANNLQDARKLLKRYRTKEPVIAYIIVKEVKSK